MVTYLKGMALGAGLVIIDLLNVAIRDLHFVLGIRPSLTSMTLLMAQEAHEVRHFGHDPVQ
jgi:hypothetical protein